MDRVLNQTSNVSKKRPYRDGNNMEADNNDVKDGFELECMTYAELESTKAELESVRTELKLRKNEHLSTLAHVAMLQREYDVYKTKLEETFKVTHTRHTQLSNTLIIVILYIYTFISVQHPELLDRIVRQNGDGGEEGSEEGSQGGSERGSQRGAGSEEGEESGEESGAQDDVPLPIGRSKRRNKGHSFRQNTSAYSAGNQYSYILVLILTMLSAVITIRLR